MLLIQCLTSVFFFVLLIHKGLGTPTEAKCKQAVSSLFEWISRSLYRTRKYRAKSWHPLTIEDGYFRKPFYFIPDDNLINILASLETPGTRSPGQIDRHNSTQSGELAAEPSVVKTSAAIIQNHFEFDPLTAYHYLMKFVVQHTDGRNGTAKILVRRTSHYEEILRKVRNQISWTETMKCFESPEEDRSMQQTKEEWNGITVTFCGQTYDVFNAQLILSSLVSWQNILPDWYVNESPWAKTEGIPSWLPHKVPKWFPKKIPEWFPSGIPWAKTAGTSNWIATEAKLNGTMIILKDKDGKVVAQSPLPDHGPDHGKLTNIDIEYIKAATKIVNAYKKGMTFRKYSEE